MSLPITPEEAGPTARDLDVGRCVAAGASFCRRGARFDAHAGYFGTTWAILTGFWLRAGQDIESVDAGATIDAYGRRPLLLIHGTADNEDLPERTQAFFDRAVSRHPRPTAVVS